MNPYSYNDLKTLCDAPVSEADFGIWIQQQDVIGFLSRDAMDDEIIVHASMPYAYLHAVFANKFDLGALVGEQLETWDVDASAGWSVVSDSTETWIDGPLERSNNLVFRGGEKIVFVRDFEGSTDGACYYELNQKLAHVLRLHYMPERAAWCGLDEAGDIVEAFKTREVSLLDGSTARVATMRQAYLQEFSEYSGLILTRMFDFTRFRSNKFDGWGDLSEETLINQDLIRGRLNVQQALGSYSRGLQVIPLSQSSGRAKKRYETFIAQDLRHHATGEFSCDPDKLSNYFQPTDSPHEVSPAFFRPEVLSKYKADTQKYRIEERRITCRGAWTLEHFGINDAGQVHAYLVYLGRLPHKEQLHWKSFNEAPMTGLAAHTVATDFEGAFVEIDDPLQNLKRQLAKLERQRVGWWKLRAPDLPRCAHYPVTDSRDEWASELMNLDKLLVEGFVHKWLRRMACSLGRELDEKWQSLQLLHECFIGLGFEGEASRQITAPLRQVHMYRSKLKGHASESEPRELEAAARHEFGDLRMHFRELCSKCNDSLRVITTAFAGGI